MAHMPRPVFTRDEYVLMERIIAQWLAEGFSSVQEERALADSLRWVIVLALRESEDAVA